MHGIMRNLKVQKSDPLQHQVTPGGHRAAKGYWTSHKEWISAEELTEAANRLRIVRKALTSRIHPCGWNKHDVLNKPHQKPRTGN